MVSMVALLALLILGVVHRARRGADTAQSMANLRTLAAANIAYLGEVGRYAPADDKRNLRRWHGGRRSVDEKFDPAGGFLAPYLGKSRCITPCPLFRDMLSGADTFEDGTGGYGYNAAYIGGTPGGKWSADGTRESALAAHVPQPAATVMFASTAYARAKGLQEYPYAEPPFWDFGKGASGSRPSPTVHFRFGGKALVAWCDGHVTAEPPVERPAGTNPHGGNVEGKNLGWFGPDENNGFWNPASQLER